MTCRSREWSWVQLRVSGCHKYPYTGTCRNTWFGFPLYEGDAFCLPKYRIQSCDTMISLQALAILSIALLLYVSIQVTIVVKSWCPTSCVAERTPCRFHRRPPSRLQPPLNISVLALLCKLPWLFTMLMQCGWHTVCEILSACVFGCHPLFSWEVLISEGIFSTATPISRYVAVFLALILKTLGAFMVGKHSSKYVRQYRLEVSSSLTVVWLSHVLCVSSLSYWTNQRLLFVSLKSSSMVCSTTLLSFYCRGVAYNKLSHLILRYNMIGFKSKSAMLCTATSVLFVRPYLSNVYRWIQWVQEHEYWWFCPKQQRTSFSMHF